MPREEINLLQGGSGLVLFLGKVLLRRKCKLHSLPRLLRFDFAFDGLFKKVVIAVNTKDEEKDFLVVGFSSM
jgi:hypothetical protein